MNLLVTNSEPQNDPDYIRSWTLEFSSLIIITAILSGIFYTLQNAFFLQNNVVNDALVYNLVRAIRMTLFYVVVPILFLKRHNRNWRDFGVIPTRQTIVPSLLGGLFVYSVAISVFLRYEIFYGTWLFLTDHEIMVKIVLVGIMASITDLWTRGFILFQIADKFSDKLAIGVQNLTWFVIHIYEIDALEPYIGILGGILLTLFLGIGGDIVALKTRNIFGLMFGHVLLNIAIMMAATNII